MRTLDEIVDALADFLELIEPTAEIVRGQSNRTPQPVGPHMVLTEMFTADLTKPYQVQSTINKHTRIDVQIDCYDVDHRGVKTAFESEWGWDRFPAWLKPLYTSDGTQAPMTGGEDQWLKRWILTASLQYNQELDVPQEFADTAIVTDDAVDI